MDLTRILVELRSELQRIDSVIQALERLDRSSVGDRANGAPRANGVEEEAQH